ncbi:2-oxoglutarate/2-oxoacid ferredoxin oxidoreductase subunit alpha [Candidatus Gastranaerophilus sp. (ex Termes propinquus)]|nr:2-oxoglutarate/2-oxoacid ferredoxin oxidoreductase subunit alpha [Candidatus Gastranaerophilus sp. (ex Termes propinquus)]
MVNFVISGEAGQGIESAMEMAVKTLHAMHLNVCGIPEYMSRIRGGCNSVLIKVTDEYAPYYSEKVDYCFVLDDKAYEHLKARTEENTKFVGTEKTKGSNIYALGYIFCLLDLEADECLEFLKKSYSHIFLTSEENIERYYTGHKDANDIQKIIITREHTLQDKKLFTGNMSQSLGAIAGGANFISYYPMSPSTEFSTILTQFSDEFNIISEQVEDEIAAINMALGASYAGARACVSTSGGGFALMSEGVSLSGMSEIPVVIHLAQRPGPATGLPTRTAQEDLNLALYAGHGEFERILLSPSSVEDSFEIAQRAFNQAQKYQVPVFILSEQCLLETICSTDKLTPFKNEEYLTPTPQDYKRYRLGDSPITPLAAPGFGEGLVCTISDEHDERGRITESEQVRKEMVDKRLAKYELMVRDHLPPYFLGNSDCKKLIISWGSNFKVLKAAIKDRGDFALLHFRQLYPLDNTVLKYTEGKELIIFEQNAKGQLARLLSQEFGLKFAHKHLKYNGTPLGIEDATRFLDEI